MSCFLDDPSVQMILEQIDNDSSSCIFRLMDLENLASYSEFLEKNPEIATKVKYAKAIFEKAQMAMDVLKDLVVDRDTTEYFEGMYFSNMGWRMAASFISDGIAPPVHLVRDHLLWRTKNNKKCIYGLNKLIRQGLVERKKLTVPKFMWDNSFTEETESCICLSDIGRDKFMDDRFIYSPDWPHIEVQRTNNIIQLPLRKSE